MDIEDVLSINKNGEGLINYKISNVNFIITHIISDKYSIKIEYLNKVSKMETQGKIFFNGGNTVKKHLINNICSITGKNISESGLIVDELWNELSDELGDWVFGLSTFKIDSDTQFFRTSDSMTINVDNIAKKLMEDNYFLTFEDNKIVYFYENGVYINGGEDKIEQLVRNNLKNYSTINRINEIIRNIKSKSLIDRDCIETDLKLINMKNGMFEISSGKLLPHSPKYQSTTQINVAYDKDAKCPNVDKFMHEILPDEDVKTMYEAIGYAMIPKTNIRNATCILVGKGANGKSKMLDMIRVFIGTKNISAESLQQLEDDKYSTSNLYGKLLNIFSDLSSKQMYDNNIFKILTGDDKQIRGEIKFKSNFYFDNTARLMFSANKLPPVPDDEMYAFFSRMMIFKFCNKFEGKAEDKNILSKITTDEEISGLFNIVIESLKTVLKNDTFSYSKEVKAVENEYRMNSDDVLMFIKEKVDENASTNIPTNIMYTVYEKWCETNKVSIQSKIRFNKRLKSLDFQRSKYGARGNQVDSWSNCKFKSAEDESQQEIQVNKPLIQVPLVKIE